MGEQPILGVDDLLGRYRAGGQAESSGSFTLDTKKALERLARFQLPNPNQWVLKVIQSLHLSGAHEIKVEAGINGVLVTSDVAPEGFGSMDDLLAQLLAEVRNASPALRHLAAGMQGSLGVQPRMIRLTIVSEGQKRTYTLQAGGWRDAMPEPAPEGVESFELKLSRNISERWGSSWFLLNVDIFDLLFRRRGALDRENKEIDRACNFTNCNITAAGRSVNLSLFGRPRFNGYDITQDPAPGKTRAPTIRALYSADLVKGAAHMHHHLAEVVVPADSPGGFRLEPTSHATCTNRRDPEIVEKYEANGLSRAYALRMELASRALIVFWEDGVVLQTYQFDSEILGLVALVDAKDFRKDITTFKVREDEEFGRLKKDVLEMGERLKRTVAENLHLMPAGDYVAQRLRLNEFAPGDAHSSAGTG